MRMTDPVRVRLADDQETTVERAYADSKGLTVVDKPAVDRAGRALPATGYSSAEQVTAAVAEQADVKGAALDDALTAAGLSTTGKAAEKRKRLADHLAAAANAPDPNGTPPGGPAHTAPEGTDQ